MDEKLKGVNPFGSVGYIVNGAPLPTAVETLEHLENTLDNLDPVVPEHVEEPEQVHEGEQPETAAPSPEVLDAAADAVIAEVTGESVPEGTGQPNTSATHDEPSAP